MDWYPTPHTLHNNYILFALSQILRSDDLTWQQGQIKTLKYFLTFLVSDSFVCLCFDPVCLLQEVTSFSARNGWTSHSSFLAIRGWILVTVTRFLTPEEKTVKSLLAGCGRGKYFAGLISWNWQALLRPSSIGSRKTSELYPLSTHHHHRPIFLSSLWLDLSMSVRIFRWFEIF